MAKIIRLFKNFVRLVLPVCLLLIIAFTAAGVWLVQTTAQPPHNAYLVTPEKYGRFSPRGARVTEETWTNGDGTGAHGWLLRGTENAPAVVMFHRYGADRSYLLDLGVKINEATDFTILMPDERGHGENPPVKNTSFGGCETDGALAAVAFVRSLKSDGQHNLVGEKSDFTVSKWARLPRFPPPKTQISKFSRSLLPSVSGFPFASFVTSQIAAQGTYL